MEKINVDLNSLFNLSYNFENLKLFLSKIGKNQDLIDSKLKELDKRTKQNSKTIDSITSEIELNKQLTNIDTFNNYLIEEAKKQDNQNGQNEQNDLPANKSNTQFLNLNDPDMKNPSKKSSKNLKNEYDYKVDKETKYLITELENRIHKLEDKFKNIDNFIPKFPEDKTKTLNDILEEIKSNINNLTVELTETNTNVKKIQDDLETLNVKVSDFNVYDIFKEVESSGVNMGDIDLSKILIQNLEKKVFDKFKIQEEKIRKDEEDLLKFKSEITNMKNLTNMENRSINTLKERFSKIENENENYKTEQIEKINKIKNDIESINDKSYTNNKNLESKIKNFNDQFQTILKQIDELKENKKETESIEKKQKKEDEYIVTSTSKAVEKPYVELDEYQEFKETVIKKYYNLDKKYQSLNSNIKPEDLLREINEIKIKVLNKKPTEQEFYDTNIQVERLSELFDSIKSDVNMLQSDLKKTKDNFINASKKYEVLIMKAISQSKSNEETDEFKNTNKQAILQKFDDYVEITIFNEFIKEQTKFSDKLKKDFDNYKKFYDEIIETLKKAASVQDLKNLEEYFVDLLDELKDKSNKLFTRRSDVNKNFKSIELQIRQLYECISKKDEHSDKWMLAKKPIGGFSCASCENYIGDLKENNEKILWNQFPERKMMENKLEINANRIGNGFSRILNLVNITHELKNDNLFNSDVIKPDYGSSKNEKEKENTINNNEDTPTKNNLIMSSTISNYNKNVKKHLNKEILTLNNTTNHQSNSSAQDDSINKFGMTTTDKINSYKDLKLKKNSKVLPPITQNEDVRSLSGNLNEYIEEIKDQKSTPKITKIVRKVK